MTNRMYRGLLGTLILIFLYIDHAWLIYSLIAMLLFEGITNLTVPRIINQLFQIHVTDEESSVENPRLRWNVSAERFWRLVVGSMLLLSYLVLYQYLWVIPWFFGFAILGSGLSGVCPGLLAIRWAGFR
jgi:uncharacterized membrane protein